MRRFSLLCLSISTILFFSNCSKSSDSPAPTNPIVGLWIGTQLAGDGSTTTPLYYSYDLKSDSTVLVQGSGGDGLTYYSIGKWSLSGTSFTAIITVSNLSQAGVKQTITAIYNKDLGTLAGTIQTVGVNYSGTFTLDRIN